MFRRQLGQNAGRRRWLRQLPRSERREKRIEEHLHGGISKLWCRLRLACFNRRRHTVKMPERYPYAPKECLLFYLRMYRTVAAELCGPHPWNTHLQTQTRLAPELLRTPLTRRGNRKDQLNKPQITSRRTAIYFTFMRSSLCVLVRANCHPTFSVSLLQQKRWCSARLARSAPVAGPWLGYDALIWRKDARGLQCFDWRSQAAEPPGHLAQRCKQAGAEGSDKDIRAARPSPQTSDAAEGGARYTRRSAANDGGLDAAIVHVGSVDIDALSHRKRPRRSATLWRRTMGRRRRRLGNALRSPGLGRSWNPPRLGRCRMAGISFRMGRRMGGVSTRLAMGRLPSGLGL